MYIQRRATRQRWLPLLGVIALVAATGCGGFKKYGADVTGTVTIDGELARSGTVTFHPTDKAGKIAVGRIYPDGSFSLRTGQGDLSESDGGTVVPGEYVVTVVVAGPSPAPTTPGGPPPAGPLLIAERYIDRDTTDLRTTIVAGENVLAFDLERATSDAESTEAESSEADKTETNGAEDATPLEGAEIPNTDVDSVPVEGAKP